MSTDLLNLKDKNLSFNFATKRTLSSDERMKAAARYPLSAFKLIVGKRSTGLSYLGYGKVHGTVLNWIQGLLIGVFVRMIPMLLSNSIRFGDSFGSLDCSECGGRGAQNRLLIPTQVASFQVFM